MVDNRRHSARYLHRIGSKPFYPRMRIAPHDPESCLRSLRQHTLPDLFAEIFHTVDVCFPVHGAGENHERADRHRIWVVFVFLQIHTRWNHADVR